MNWSSLSYLLSTRHLNWNWTDNLLIMQNIRNLCLSIPVGSQRKEPVAFKPFLFVCLIYYFF